MLFFYPLLGIHEPVYGKVQKSNSKMFVSKTGKVMKMMNNAIISSSSSSTTATTTESETDISPVLSQIADSNAIPFPLVVTRSNYSQAPVATRLVDLVNLGQERAAPSVRRPSPEAEAVISKKRADLAQEADRIKAKRVSSDGAKQQKKKNASGMSANASASGLSWRSNLKLPKLTTVAAVGLAKTREVDGSGKFMGPLTKTHTPSRSRYHNV
jgi:hypothetical protein